ncbi:MAG TPA: FG-GAP-like repeat-containing protein [Candidatus Limnocylindria bacterium]|nr:FG-GAP-like repeat-containing protein [Candidatus Limnocylindria bacterium]
MNTLPRVLLLILSALVVGNLPVAAELNQAASPQQPARRDTAAFFDANETRLAVSNFGALGHGFLLPSQAGLEWPKGSGKSVLFASGLWIGARVSGDTLVTTADYVHEYAAGPLGPSGLPLDPTESDPAHRVYRIKTGDNTANNLDYASWPSALGAPVDGQGQPLLLADQTLWCVYNDAVVTRHTNNAGGTAPLAVEVRQSVFGYDRGGALGRTMFVRFEILNKGTNLLEDAFVGFWFDADLGGAANDLVGCDTTLDLGFAYDNSIDAVYGSDSPAFGCAVLQGPTVAGDTLEMTSFGRLLKNFNEPMSSRESYLRLAGVLPELAPRNCGVETHFEASGDPIYQTGCLDDKPADRRFMLSTGPFTMAPGDTQSVVVAFIVGGRPDAGDRLTNLRLLKQYVLNAREAHARGFQNVPSLPEADPGPIIYLGAVNEPLTFNAMGSADDDGSIASYVWDFGDGQPTASGPIVSHTYSSGGLFDVTLTVTDDDGLSVTAKTRADVHDPGTVSVGFTDATFRGVSAIEYLNVDNVHRRPFAGVNWGGRFYEGGFDTGCRWSGSSIAATPDDLALCPGAALAPERFQTVELRFDGTQSAYQYFRRELASGAPPASGRGYTFQGRRPVPFQAWGIRGDRREQLEVMFTERQVTNDAGVPSGPQPSSQNNLWSPTADDSGGHEYLQIVSLTYLPSGRAGLAQDGVFFGGTLPVLYGGWLRLRSSTDSVDPDDRLVARWADLGDEGYGLDAAWGDMDGDGDLDLFVMNGSAPSRLFQNDGATGFSEVALPEVAVEGDVGHPSATHEPRVESGDIEGGSGFALGRSVNRVDVDGDGDLDLYLVYLGATNQLLRNDNGTFVRVFHPALAGNGGGAEGSWVDFDRDGDVDCYLSNDANGNQLVRNDGTGGFTIVTPPALARLGPARWADLDNDRDPDLYLVQEGMLLRNDGDAGFTDVTSGVLAGTDGLDAQWADFDNDGDLDLYLVRTTGNRLLRNDGGFSFTDITSGPLAGTYREVRCRWLDYDGDAHLDLLMISGTRSTLLRNEGDGTFADVSTLLPTPSSNHGATVPGDYDADGDQDIYFANFGANDLLRNDLDRARFLRLTLRGQVSNRFGVGARVRVAAHGVSQTRELDSDAAGTVVFGLDGASIVDTVEVLWPSGLLERQVGVPVFSDLTIVEGNASGPVPSRLSLGRVVPNPGNGRQIFEVLVASAPSAVKLRIYDVAGRRVWEQDFVAPMPGAHLVQWDGRDQDGRDVPGAVYFARISDGSGTATKRFVRFR